MTSNVTRLLLRPRALSQRSLPLSSSTRKRLIQYQSPSETLKDEEANKILRVADQSALRKTNRSAANFISSIHNLQKAIETIPTTITDPDIEGEYTLGSIREKVRDTPVKAQAVIDAVERVQLHLRDLTVQGYDKKKDAKDLVRKFEEEIEGWSEEEKRDQLKTWQLQEEGRIVRLNDASQRLVEFVNKKLRAKGKSKVPDFNIPKGSAVVAPIEREDKLPEPKPEPAEIKPLAVDSKPPSKRKIDLFDLQKQLEENVASSSDKK